MNISPITGDAPTWDPSLGTRALREAFDRNGFVLLRDIKTPGNFLDQLGGLGRIYRHHDSLPNGLTHIKRSDDTRSRGDAADTNRLGLTQNGLTPHTDRSGACEPPRLLAFWIEHQSSIGGASLFVDGHQLFDEVSTHQPEAIEALTRPRSVVFKSEAGLLEGSVFTLRGTGMLVRFRFDRMVYMSPDVAAVMPTFTALMRQVAIKQRLGSDEGYLIDNHRWLHGRTHFSGTRSAYRLLLDQRSAS